MLPFLLPLLNKPRWPTRGEVALIASVLVILLLMSWTRRGEEIARLREALSAKPLVEERVKEKVVTRVEKGPIRIETRTIERPGGERVVERVVYRDRVVTETGSERTAERQETAVCPAFAAPRTWALGGGLDLRRRDRGAFGVSKSFGDLSLGLSHSVGAGAQIGDFSAGISLKVF